jgi:regulator of protease activity HflC (stomatin/prohibitin superfamily)
MFDIGFFKAQPTDWVQKYVNGQAVKEGTGLAFYFLHHNAQIVTVPTSSAESHWVFNEVTNNFQLVTIQGQCTYRINNPRQAAAILNFTMEPATRRYVTDDPARLPQRIANVIQVETRSEIQQRSLEETLVQTEVIGVQVLRRIRDAELLASLGVELLSLFIVSAKPTPEVAKALEARYRETLLRQADEAIYARRAAAVEEERKIKENELNTDITLEEGRRNLIDLQGANAQQEAQHRGAAFELEAEHQARAAELHLALYRSLDPRTIMALAMQEFGKNAEHIGNLTLTSEMFASLLNGSNALNVTPPDSATRR